MKRCPDWIKRIELPEDGRDQFGFDWTDSCTKFRLPGEKYELGEIVRLRPAPGFEVECVAAGQTPELPLVPTVTPVLNAELADGPSVRWRWRAISNASLRRTILNVAASVWTPDVGFLAEDAIVINAGGEQKTAAWLSLAPGQPKKVYRVKNVVTFSDTARGVGVYEVTVI